MVDILRRTLPEGVELSVHEHRNEHFEARFIPDPFIEGIRKEIQEYEDKRMKAREESKKK